MPFAKRLINGFLGCFGFQLNRVPHPDAGVDPVARSFAKGNTTKSHNTARNMDEFYADPNLMTHYFTKERLAFYRQVRDRLTRLKISPADVLDVGCGSGHLLSEVKAVFPAAHLTGVDFSPESIKLARKLHPALAFDVLSIFDVEQLGRQFDLILCTEVIEHLEEAGAAVEKLLAVCRPGGAVVITVPEGRRDTFAGHFNFWTPESFRREFRHLNPQVEEFASYLFIVIQHA
jgi:2-polyprenyl-3-methyl-5-hydroxy-6-metoxy-1,4-benzoquinol methylase